MIIDNYLVFSDAQTITSTAASTSHVDSLAAADAVSPGARLKVQVNTAFVSAGGATLTIALQCDSDSAFGSVKTLFTTTALAVADIDAIGDVPIDIQIPPALGERYLRVYYTVATSTFSAGKIDARIVLDTNKTHDKQL